MVQVIDLYYGLKVVLKDALSVLILRLGAITFLKNILPDRFLKL
jgi:hypothetical protein